MFTTRFNTALYISILIAVFLFIGINKTLSLRPQSVHQWAQCDRASVALNFGEDTYNIFKPRVHNIGNGSGITGMEFPIINYTVGILYRGFGHLEWIYRFIMMLTISSGLIAAFAIAHQLIKNFIFAASAVLLMYLSPVLVFYTPNFIPDTASLGFIFVAWFYYFKYRNNSRKKYLLLLVLFALLSSLIKITSLISVITMLLISFIEILAPMHFDKIKSGRNTKVIYSLFFILLATASWYLYSNWLNTKYGSSMFLMRSAMPSSMTEFVGDIKYIHSFWWTQYYTKTSFYLFLSTAIFILGFIQYANRLYLYITAFLWIGTACFIVLMLSQFRDHDYYIITLLPVVFFQLLTFYDIINNLLKKEHKIIRFFISIFIIILVGHNVIFCKSTYQDRYQPDSWMKSPIIFNKYFEIGDYCKQLGITRTDMTVSAYDWSNNVSLYLMDLKGIRITTEEGPAGILKAIKQGADYLIINDKSVLSDENIIPYLTNKLGEKNGILIYKL
jgi:hypothetical protein